MIDIKALYDMTGEQIAEHINNAVGRNVIEYDSTDDTLWNPSNGYRLDRVKDVIEALKSQNLI